MTGGTLAPVELSAELADCPVAFGDDVVGVDRLQVHLAGLDEVGVAEIGVRLERLLQRDADGVLDEARLEVGMLDHEQLVGPLEQLVDRRAHRALDDVDEVLGVDRLLRPDVEGAPAALVVGRERDELEDTVDVQLLEAGLEQPLGSLAADEALCARAGVDPGCLDADDAAGALGRGAGDPDQRDHLLGAHAGDRGLALDRVQRGHLDLGAQGALAADDGARDVLGELLDEQRLADHELVDRLLEQLREARHVDAALRGVEVDRAGDLGGDELLVRPAAEADRLAHAPDAGPGQAELHLGDGGLEVGAVGAVCAPFMLQTYQGGYVPEEPGFAKLVSLACHDLRTPLATIFGFARTLTRSEGLDPTFVGYSEMIEAASDQLGELIDELSLAARIESGRYDPKLERVSTDDLAAAAVERLGDDRVAVSGQGEDVLVDPETAKRSVSALVQCALRHGGLEQVEVVVAGPELRVSPITASSAPVVLGRDLRDLGAAVAVVHVERLGGSVSVDGDTLTVRLP